MYKLSTNEESRVFESGSNNCTEAMRESEHPLTVISTLSEHNRQRKSMEKFYSDTHYNTASLIQEVIMWFLLPVHSTQGHFVL